METQAVLQKMTQSSFRQNLLQAKAESSIKRHQIRGFINAGSGSSEINLMENDQNSQLAEHLLQLKTSCSGVKVQIKHKELEQFKYKDETCYLSQKVKVIQNERYQLQNQITKLKSVVEDVKNKKLNAMLGCKSYEHILDRMKKDEIRYQIRRNQLEKDLKGLEKNYKDISNKSYELKEYEFMSISGLKEAQDQVLELNCNRKNTLYNMNNIMDQKNILEQKKKERKGKSDIIKEMAAGDLQDADLIRMKKFLTVQVFLKSMLKNKIEKLKDFYEPYQLAFLKIKGNTNVKDASTLKVEYHNFQMSYSQKSSWVKHLEEQISKSELQKKNYQQEYSTLKQKQLQILEEIQNEENVQGSEGKKQLQNKADHGQIMMMSVRQWLKVQSKRMEIDGNGKSESLVLKEICQKLKEIREQNKIVVIE